MKQTSQRSLLFRQNVNRTESDRRRVCPRQVGRRMRTRLRPRRWSVDRAAIGKWNIVWQLVSCRKVRRNVSAVGGMKTKVGSALVRIEYQNLLFEFVTNEIKRSNKVCIAADEHNGVCRVRVCVTKHFGYDVDVGTFFLHFHHMNISISGRSAVLAVWVNGRNPYLVLVVVALYDLYAAMCLDCLKIDILALNSGCVIGIGLNTCSEVFYGNEFVRFVKKRTCERSQVKPLATGSSAKKPEVEVATIDIRNCFHSCQLKMLRSQTLRFGTPLRVGRTVRLDMNPLTGSVGIIPNIISWRNGVWRRNRIMEAA